MKLGRHVLIMAGFWLIVSALAILAFAGIISPQVKAESTSRIYPAFPVEATTGEEIELSLNLENINNDFHYSLSQDSGNRHSVVDSLTLPGNLENVTIDPERQLAILANSFSGIQIADISNPARLRLLGSLTTPGNAWDIIIRGDLLFLAAARSGLQVVNISDPESPVIIGELVLPKTPLLKLAIHEDTIFASSGKRGLQIIDIRQPDKPRLVKSLHTSDGTWGVFVNQESLFLSSGLDHLETYSLQDPHSPSPLGRLNISGRAWDMAMQGNFLYLPVRKEGLITVNLTNLVHPVRTSSGEKVDVETIEVQGETAYLTNREGDLFLYDLSVPSQPVQKKKIDLSYRPRNIDLLNRTLYVAGGLSGLLAIDLDTLPAETAERSLDLSGSLYKVLINDRFFYLATKKRGLFIAEKNLTDRLPRLIAKVPVEGNIRNMVRIENHLYLSSNNAGLQIVDVSDPYKPGIVRNLNYPKSIHDIATDGTSLYLATETDGLLVANVTFPGNPVLVGHLQISGINKMGLADNKIYILSNHSELHTVDISQPTRPVELGRTALPWPLSQFAKFFNLAISDETILVAAGTAKLVLFNVSDPKKPRLEEIIQLSGEALAVNIEQDNVFVTTRQGRLWILRKDKDGTMTPRSVIDTLGSGYEIRFDGDQIILANGLKGLTFLPRPQQFTFHNQSTGRARGNAPAILNLKIPGQPLPATYNLAFFYQGELFEHHGALKVVENPE